MNLRELVAEYAAWCHRFNEALNWAGPGAEKIRRLFDEAEQRVKRAIELSEAAMEHCEAVQRLDQIREVPHSGAEFVEASNKIDETYRRWLKLHESVQANNTSGKEWWYAK